ncbi:alpha-1,6-mannosyltransferase subunit [Dentipellis sp. KUC8613]|nr:alpha-1,6-mannosyltransferase subunit [Dentipellis sp. KUC8613]
MSFALDILTLGTAWAHVLLAPYTKVEESFNLHATHDILFYGVSPPALPNYDHFTFSGAVPRSFLGSLALAYISTPVIHLATHFELLSSKFDTQVLIRLVLATLNALPLCLLRRAVGRRFGRPTGLLFALLTSTQFHLPFWMGRTLPNMFALVFVNLATYFLINRSPNSPRPSSCQTQTALALLIFATATLRAELAPFLGFVTLQSLFNGTLRLRRAIVAGLLSIGSYTALTIGVDTYFWAAPTPLWPELASLRFNIYEGKSADWGVSPAHAYISTHLPKLLLGAFPLALFGLLIDSRVRSLSIPSLALIAAMSAIGHKEWRFVVYAIPVLNIAAARGAHWMMSRRKGSFFGRILFLAASGLILANCLATAILTRTSMANYPGGTALAQFNALLAPRANVHVHISNLAAQTGASLFLQTHAPPYPAFIDASSANNWTYDKTEDLSARDLAAMPGLTHAITEAPLGRGWTVVDVVKGFERWALQRDVKGLVEREGIEGLLGVLKMVEGEKLWILERNGA